MATSSCEYSSTQRSAKNVFSGYAKLDAVYNCIVAMEQPVFHPAGLSIGRSTVICNHKHLDRGKIQAGSRSRKQRCGIRTSRLLA